MASTSSADSQPLMTQKTSAFEGIIPPSASTSAPLKNRPYDIFINHRGPDVKKTLATAIYKALGGKGLRVFLDCEELLLGESLPIRIQEAIRTASLHVAIFSPGYAESPWCLAELSFMLKSGTTIIPIFYHVQPSDLRWVAQGKGIYANTFLEHQEKGRYSPEKLQEWKTVLSDISYLNGEIISSNDDEQRVLKNIVNYAVKELKIVPLKVAKYPVGLEEAVADFEMTLSESVKAHPNVQVVGIWGMGGCGKTTLARELYNKKCSSAEKSSFISDIREAASRSELHKKQMRLLEDLGSHEKSFDNIEEGKMIISRYLKSVKVLIILDDIDHTDQLEALLPTKDSLGWGSLIIVTTRESKILERSGISSIYKMKTMDPVHAKQLFCWHAFLQPSPLTGFEELVENFSSVSNGLPLSLEVLGGQLYGCSSKDLWEDVLQKISRIVPRDIEKRLKVSYDALDEEEKQMFLDVACFFIGRNKMTAIAVWDGSGWSGLYGWESLVNKCLVDFDENSGITMHDHLRDLGRQIAQTQTPYRLWLPYQIRRIKKPMEIRGMLLNVASNRNYKFPARLHGLKVFVVGENYGNHLPIVKSSKELAWLRCTAIADINLPTWLPFNNLRVLELHHCKNIVGLWNDDVEAPVELRVFIVSGCQNLARIPNSIGCLKYLKRISLSNCNIVNLPKQFCRLQSLEYLELESCSKLSSLPSHFGDLTNLKHVDLRFAEQLKVLPDSFKQLRLLQYLNLLSCKMLTLKSNMLENMTKLEYLNLGNSTQLEELPHHITNQASLCELYLKGTRLRELPSNIGQLSKLRVLEISLHGRSSQMQQPMRSLNHLEQLRESLPKSLKQLTNLQTLKLDSCSITDLDFGRGPFTSSLCSLTELVIGRTRVSNISISEDCCPGLKTLLVWSNKNLTEIDTIPSTVQKIEVEECLSLRNISGIACAVNLQSLEVTNCPELKMLPDFERFASLQTLKLDRCSITDLDFGRGPLTSSLCSLTELVIGRTRVSNISISEECCPGLKTLLVWSNKNLTEIDTIPSTVQKIVVDDCLSLRNISGIACAVNLQSLEVTKCPELKMLPDFERFASLKYCVLYGGNKIERIQGLQHCTSMETLNVTGFDVLHMESLERMQRLKRLILVAKKRFAIENCIQKFQKWPEEAVVCTKAIPGAMSLLNSTAFPNLSILHSIARMKITLGFSHLVTLPKKRSSNTDAIMLCLLINCLTPRMPLFINGTDGRFSTEVDTGKWIWICVFSQPSKFFNRQDLEICEFGPTESDLSANEVEKGFLVRGGEQSIIETLHSLLGLLGEVNSVGSHFHKALQFFQYGNNVVEAFYRLFLRLSPIVGEDDRVVEAFYHLLAQQGQVVVDAFHRVLEPLNKEHDQFVNVEDFYRLMAVINIDDINNILLKLDDEDFYNFLLPDRSRYYSTM